MFVDRMVSEYCSARVSVLVLQLSKQQNRTNGALGQPAQPFSEPLRTVLGKEIPFRRALRRLPCWLGFQLGIHQKLGLSAPETVLGHLLSGDLSSPNRKPAGQHSQNWAARWPQIAESPATRPLRFPTMLLSKQAQSCHSFGN